MKNYLRFLSPVMLLLMAVMFGGGKILAQTANLTFTKACNGKGTDNKNGAWVINSDAKESTYDKDKGVHYGTTDVKVSYITATTKAYSTKKITKIVVNASAANAGSPKVSCTVGGASFGTEKALTTSNASYTFEGTATGDIVVKVSKTKGKKALYLQSIEVTYSIEGSSKTSTTLSFSKSESSFTYDLNYNGGIAELVNPATLSPNVEGATISYTISESTFADGEISVEDGTVTFYTDKEASATITASYAGNDTYEASTASYTINVVKPVTVEDGVFDFTGDGTIDYGSGLKPSTNTSYIKTSTWKAGKVTMTTSGGDGVRWWKTSGDNELRAYSNTKIAFSVPNGYVITYIDLGVYNSIEADCGSLNNTKWNGSSQVVTFTVSKTKNLKNITVKYAETLTTSARGYATYSADYAVNYSELGLTAYTLTVDETNKTVTAKEFTGVVPAGKAVLVKGAPSTTYTLTPATTEGDATFATDLQTGATKADGTQYGFTSKSGTPAFAQVVSGQDIPAKKGYIVLNGASAAKYSICFDDEATGIQTIEAASAANGAMYNLAGQRVDKAYKGIVIVNGKKYLNK